jgi:hypothetical protein
MAGQHAVFDTRPVPTSGAPAVPGNGTGRTHGSRPAGISVAVALVALASCAVQPVFPSVPERWSRHAPAGPVPTAPAVPAPPAAPGPPAPAPAAPAVEIGPGESWADALRALAPGQTLGLRPGTYDPQVLRDLALPGVALWGTDRDTVVVPQIELAAVSGLTIGHLTVTAGARDSSVRVRARSHDIRLTDATIRPRTNSGVDIFEGASAVTVDRVLIDGSAQSSNVGRGVRILNEGPPDAWSAGIVVRDSEIRHVAADGIMLAGARSVTIAGNDIHDLQANDDHNDGVSSAGSIGLRIVGNRFHSPGRSGPDQAIILGGPGGTSNLVVRDTYIANNIVGPWRGTAIILSGTEGTTVVSNSVAPGGTPDFRSASLDLRGSPSTGNSGLRVYNNVFYAVRVTNPRTDLWQDHNCVGTGARGPNDVAADPAFSDPDTLTLATASPCAAIGYRDADVPATGFGGALRGPRFAAGAW